VALVSVFLIYFMVDCFNLFGGEVDEGDCGCDGTLGSSVLLSTS
jgi:hypothetical protein